MKRSEACYQLKIGKSPGPHCIPPEILKYGKQETAKWIYRVQVDKWNSEFMYPDSKNANIETIFKKKDRCTVSNLWHQSLFCSWKTTGFHCSEEDQESQRNPTRILVWSQTKQRDCYHDPCFVSSDREQLGTKTFTIYFFHCLHKGISHDKSESTVEGIDQAGLSTKNHIYCEGSLKWCQGQGLSQWWADSPKGLQ